MTLISPDDHLTAGAWAACGYIENLDLTNLRENNQIVRYVKGWLIISFFIFDHHFFLWSDVALPSVLGSERLL